MTRPSQTVPTDSFIKMTPYPHPHPREDCCLHCLNQPLVAPIVNKDEDP